MPSLSEWGMVVTALVDPDEASTSAWGTALTVLEDPVAPGTSGWGRAVVFLNDPHQPVMVWDGDILRGTTVVTWDGNGFE